MVTITGGKCVETATVYFPGEKAAGIHSTSFNLEVWIDPGMVESDEDFLKMVAEIREKIKNLYEMMVGYTPEVWFDYEVNDDWVYP